MASAYIHNHVQSILVPKGHFKSEQEARKHVQDMGFKTDVKPVHITDNYYRYRQEMPMPNEDYRTINIGSDKAVYALKDDKNMIIGHDHHALKHHKSLQLPVKQIADSLHNPKIKQNENVGSFWPRKMPGESGGGILKPEFKQKFISHTSELTPSNAIKPWQGHQNDSFQRPKKSTLDISRGSKKYF